MKHILATLTFCMIWSLGHGQSTDSTYKNFSDTNFEVGDKILAPQIYFSLSGGMRVLYEHIDSVKVIADFLKRHPEIRIELGVHTDMRGSEKANIMLSERRASTLKHEMVTRFAIPAERVTIKGYGENQPLIAEDRINIAKTREEKERLHAKNRRVEVKIIAE